MYATSWYWEFNISIWQDLSSDIQRFKVPTLIKIKYFITCKFQSDPLCKSLNIFNQMYRISIADKRVHSLSNLILHFCLSYCRLEIQPYLDWMKCELLLHSTWQNINMARQGGNVCVWLCVCMCVSEPFNNLSWLSNSCYLVAFQQSACVLVFAWVIECLKLSVCIWIQCTCTHNKFKHISCVCYSS